jgi:phage terminase large subunit-like protein
VTDLQKDGAEMVQFGQGYASMAAPTKEFSVLVTAGKLEHFGNPVMRWMAGNVVVEEDPAGNVKPHKAKSEDRIDGIVAAIMGLARATSAEPLPESPYKRRGVLSV